MGSPRAGINRILSCTGNATDLLGSSSPDQGDIRSIRGNRHTAGSCQQRIHMGIRYGNAIRRSDS